MQNEINFNDERRTPVAMNTLHGYEADMLLSVLSLMLLLKASRQCRSIFHTLSKQANGVTKTICQEHIPKSINELRYGNNDTGINFLGYSIRKINQDLQTESKTEVKVTCDQSTQTSVDDIPPAQASTSYIGKLFGY